MSRTQQVLIHKAAVPLMANESLGAFTNALKSAGRAHVMQKFNVSDKEGSAWPVEVFSNKAVFMVVPDFKKPPTNDFHVAMKFTRSTDTGQFTFMDTMKVTPVVSFVANTGDTAAKVTKALDMDAWAPAPSLFNGVV